MCQNILYGSRDRSITVVAVRCRRCCCCSAEPAVHALDVKDGVV